MHARSLRVLSVLALLAGVCAASSTAVAAPLTAAEVMERMEKTINGFADQRMDVTMTVVDLDGSRKSYDFTIWQKGTDRRLVRFTSGELKGMATLVESRDRVYVYLPGMKKVRRVAASNMSQSFAGSDFSNDDMASVTWVGTWQPTLTGEDDGHWFLDCTPVPGAAAPYARAKLKVQKGSFQQVGVEYFDASGRKVKVFDNSRIADYHGVKRSSVVVLSDPRTGHRTELSIRDFRVNQGLADSMFTVRELEWGK
jgi:outer membrane lipoprotein-sorting protein